MAAVRVAALWRHPIKAHGVEPLDAVDLTPGQTLPWDRRWAIAHDAAKVAPGDRAWADCVNFSRGAKSPALMAIRAQVDEASGTVTLTHPDQPPLTVDPDADPEALLAWVTPLSDRKRALPAFVARADVGMTDSDFPSVSILGTASLAALSARAGRPLAQERFRGNLWLDGLEPFAEFDLVGREIAIGPVRLAVRERITRCKATMVDPETGRPDVDTLRLLREGWGHQDFGIYAVVTAGGRIAVGDAVEIPA